MSIVQRNTIARLGFECQNAFVVLSEAIVNSEDRAVDGVESSAVNDELGRFRIWAANIGGLSIGRASLDYRLRDAEYLHKNVTSLLEDLNESLCDGTRHQNAPY